MLELPSLDEMADPLFVVAVLMTLAGLVFIALRFWRQHRMLHVPFAAIAGQALDEPTIRSIQKRYFLSPKLTQLLIGKSFKSPRDILLDHDLLGHQDPLEVYKLLVAPKGQGARTGLDLSPRSVSQLIDEPAGIQVRLWELTGDNSYRLEFSDLDGTLFSILLNEQLTIDPTTLSVGGFWFWELPKSGREVRYRMIQRMTAKGTLEALTRLAKMGDGAQPHVGSHAIPIRQSAQMLLALIAASGRYRSSAVVDTPDGSLASGIYEPGQPMPQTDYPGGDCSYSPDSPFLECCVAHDYCYIEQPYGCGPCARLRCDVDFLRCMLGIAGANPIYQQMAFLYFTAVRAFGEIVYEGYCGGEGGSQLGTAIVVVASGTVAGFLANSVVVEAGAGMGTFFQSGFVGVVGATAAAAALALAGLVQCGICTLAERIVEACEEDRVVRGERCTRRKKRCKKKKWWKKLWCKFKYFWVCVVYEYIVRGACWLSKQGYKLVC